MKYIRPVIAGLFSIVMMMHLSATASFCSETEIKALQEKVTALEKKIDRLEKKFNKRFLAIEKKARPAQDQDNALESKASKEVKSIIDLISKEQIAPAKTRLAEFFKKYGKTKSAGRARKLNKEVTVIGMDIPAKWGIETWFQGEDEINFENQDTMLLVFWESWCGYCRRAVPNIETTYLDYKDNGLKVIGFTKINKSATPEKVTEFIEEHALTFSIAKEDGSLSKYFKVQGIPAAALVSNGKIVWRGHPARLPDPLLKKYLNIQP